MWDLAALLIALIADLAIGEPPAPLHPVVWVGQAVELVMRAAPRRSPTAQLVYGAAAVIGVEGGFIVAAWLLLRWAAALSPWLYVVIAAYLLKGCFSARLLLRSGDAVVLALRRGDLPAAQFGLRSLVSRDTTHLSAPLIAAAAVESVAENTTDSVTAPLLFFAVFGPLGALAYRIANTFDSMIGYHGQYEYLGKPAARFDDLLNLIPARLTALLSIAAAGILHLDVAGAWRVMRRDHAHTESPNAGWTMSAAAGALGVQLEKVGHYRLGDPLRIPDAGTIASANRSSAVTMVLAIALCALLRAGWYVVAS